MRLKNNFLALVATLCLGPLMLASAQKRDLPQYVIDEFGQPPVIPTGELSPALADTVQLVFVDAVTQPGWEHDQLAGLQAIVQSADPRLVWHIADMVRFYRNQSTYVPMVEAASSLLGKDMRGFNPWNNITNHLIAWDIPAPPNYLAVKRVVFTKVEPDWQPLFVEGDIDWRWVSWGGVLMDTRAYDQTHEPCNCIPAADNPRAVPAEHPDAQWLDDDTIVFGVQINGEARAYPRRIMEVREMVNDSLGGRDLAIPYCTLCGAAQAFFTDNMPVGVERPILRTSGLLSRSNKVMYDLGTNSLFDTFLGKAVTGPLADIGLTLDQAPVVTTTWAQWRLAHPQTTVLVEALALGRDFDFRAGRDARGPIFPIGDVDPRLGVQEDVVGVIAPTGQAIAFPAVEAQLALQRGQAVMLEGVQLVADAGGLRAIDETGTALPSHQAFWFAWSQFHPGTLVWTD